MVSQLVELEQLLGRVDHISVSAVSADPNHQATSADLIDHIEIHVEELESSPIHGLVEREDDGPNVVMILGTLQLPLPPAESPDCSYLLSFCSSIAMIGTGHWGSSPRAQSSNKNQPHPGAQASEGIQPTPVQGLAKPQVDQLSEPRFRPSDAAGTGITTQRHLSRQSPD